MVSLTNLLSGLSDLTKFDNAAQLIVSRLLFRRQGLVVYRFRGLEVLIDHDGGDQCGTRSCLITDMYSRYFDRLPKGRPLNVLDLGANGGGLALSLSAEGFMFDVLGCVEMNPATYHRLQFNMGRNVQAASIMLLHAAAYHFDGEIEVQLAQGNTADSVHRRDGSGTLQRIATRSFDSIVGQGFGDASIDLCKIDIEGAEYELLLSGSATRLRQARYIIIEVHPHATRSASELLDHMTTAGFERLDGEQITSDTCAVHLFGRKD